MGTPTSILSNENVVSTPTDPNTYGTSYGVKNMQQVTDGNFAYGVYGKGPAYVANRYQADPVSDFLLNYRLDGNDSITPVNSPTIVQGKECPENRGSSFDGATQYYNADADSSKFNGLQTGISMTVWVKTTDTIEQFIACGNSLAGGDGLFLKTNNVGKFQYGTNNTFTTGDTVISTGDWVHLASTYNGTTLTLYVNAVQDKQTNITHNVLAPSTFKVGTNSGASFQFYTGALDGFRLYSRVLSVPEIQSIYEYTCI